MRFDPVPIIIGFITLAIVLLIVIFGAKIKTENLDSKEKQAGNSAAKLGIEDKDFYLSPDTFIKQKDIVINNNGTATLFLSDLKTSCDCFDAGFVDSNPDTNPANQTSIDAGGSIILRVLFDPEKYREVLLKDQTVAFSSNDPDNKEIIINFHILEN